MMRRGSNLKWFIAGVAFSIVLTATLPALAASLTQSVTITYRDIKVTLNGQQIELANEPFLLNGTTYLPLREVASALELDVSWDGSTSTVKLTRSSAPSPSAAQSNGWSNAPDNTKVWIANRTSLIAHSTSSCSNMSSPVESTKGEVVARGGRPCESCWINRG